MVRFKKRRLFSPAAVSILHFSILVSLWYSNAELRSIRSPIAWSFWLCAVACLIAYYECCLIDPGFQAECVSKLIPGKNADRVRAVVERAEQEAVERAEKLKAGYYRDPADELIDKIGVDHARNVRCGSSADDGESSGRSDTYTVGGDHEGGAKDHVVIDFASEETEAGVVGTVASTGESLSDRGVRLGGALEISQGSSVNESPRSRALGVRRVFVHGAYACVYVMMEVAQSCALFARAGLVPFTGIIRPTRKVEAHRRDDSSHGAEDVLKLGVATIYQDGEKLWFCNTCKIFRPLRAKHCNDCGYCVRVYDHHCPWIGVCVGERNHGWFYLFLFYQTIELIYATGLAIYTTIVNSEWLDSTEPSVAVVLPHVYLMFMILIMMSLALVTMSLLCFHSILLTANLSTWELTCWDKISYLKTKSRSKGSPFGAHTVRDNVTLGLQIPNPLWPGRKWNPHILLKSLRKFRLGPNNELFWTIREQDGADYGPPPSLLANKLCNIYELCA